MKGSIESDGKDVKDSQREVFEKEVAVLKTKVLWMESTLNTKYIESDMFYR